MEFKKILLRFVCLVALLSFQVKANETLRFFISIARNGIREPDINLQTGEKTGQTLTPAGMRQQYLLGTYYAQRYRKFYPNYLDAIYDPYKLYVRSSNKDRNLNSAQSLLLGIYPFGSGPNVTSSNPAFLTPPLTLTTNISKLGSAAAWNNYQPIAIRSTTERIDFLLRAYYPETCPTVNQTRLSRKSDPAYLNVSRLVESTAEQIRNATNVPLNVNLNTLEDMFNFHDTVVSNTQNGIETGINQPSELFRTIEYLAQFHDMYVYNGNTQLLQAGLGPLIAEMLSNINSAASKTNTLQGMIFLAHDTTIAGLLTVLGASNYQCATSYFESNKTNDINCTRLPLFSSHLEFELVGNYDKLTVRVLYDGLELTPCNGKSCSLSEFKTLMTSFTVTPAQYETLCGNPMLRSSPYKEYDYNNSTSIPSEIGSSGGVFGFIILDVALAIVLIAIKKFGRNFVKSKFASRPNQIPQQEQPLVTELKDITNA